MAPLSEAEIRRYGDEGWLVPKLTLPQAQVDGLCAALDRLIAVAPGRPLLADPADVALAQKLDERAFDEADAVDVELQPGQMSMHDVYMIHGARPNRSGQRRTGVALRYMPGTSVFERGLNPAGGRSGVPVAFATRPIRLLRGADRTGRNDFAVGF